MGSPGLSVGDLETLLRELDAELRKSQEFLYRAVLAGMVVRGGVSLGDLDE